VSASPGFLLAGRQVYTGTESREGVNLHPEVYSGGSARPSMWLPEENDDRNDEDEKTEEDD